MWGWFGDWILSASGECGFGFYVVGLVCWFPECWFGATCAAGFVVFGCSVWRGCLGFGMWLLLIVLLLVFFSLSHECVPRLLAVVSGSLFIWMLVFVVVSRFTSFVAAFVLGLVGSCGL